jgi:Flp pilus assembly protein TadD
VLADPNLVDAYANMASQLLKEGRNTEALPILKTAVSKAPRDLELWLKLGVAAASSLRWSDAQEALERVRGLAPTDVKTREFEAWLNKRLPPELKGSSSLP